MDDTAKTLLSEIEAFLAETGMAESYFAKAAANNGALVSRLRKNGRVWPETAAKVRFFMAKRRRVLCSGRGNTAPQNQGPDTQDSEAAA